MRPHPSPLLKGEGVIPATIICTTYNESKTIGKLLESIEKQTVKPAEVVICDGSKDDNTANKILEFKKKLPIKLIRKPGCNRSVGRNIAIESAKTNILAVTDAGCVLDSLWLELITKPIFDKEAEVVGGYYQPIIKSPLEEAIVPYVAVVPSKLDKNIFLPSSRSVAFTKNAWIKAGKYPEKDPYNEDIIFAFKLKTYSKLTVIPEAKVKWYLANSITNFYTQIKNYAIGDVEFNYKPHKKKIVLMFIRYAILLPLPFLLPIYLVFWPAFKHYRDVKSLPAKLLLPTVQLTCDLAILTGAVVGFYHLMFPKTAKENLGARS
jgi:glycosyltransferase involved in cell wall biosynthesis